MKQHEVDAIFEKAEENQVILELWDRPAGEIRLVDLKAILNSFVVKDEIRAMTPLEHQWMDFKKILSELVVFQEDYEEQTKDTLPGNQYYSDKLIVIVNNAKQAISESELPSVNFRDGKPYNYCPTCGREEPPEETDEEISLRMWEEYGKFCTYKSGKGASPKSFPNWLKERTVDNEKVDSIKEEGDGILPEGCPPWKGREITSELEESFDTLAFEGKPKFVSLAIDEYIEAHPLKFAEHSLEGHNNRSLMEDIRDWLKERK